MSTYREITLVLSRSLQRKTARVVYIIAIRRHEELGPTTLKILGQ
jgi:hypothetical protein